MSEEQTPRAGPQPKPLRTGNFISIPPHTMLENKTITQHYHHFYGKQRHDFFTIGEVKRVLAAFLHALRGKPFAQFNCIPNCDLWKLAEETMKTGADKAIALQFILAPDGSGIYFRDLPQAEIAVQDALRAIMEAGNKATQTPPPPPVPPIGYISLN